MFRKPVIALFTLISLSAAAQAADPIVGNWLTESGETAAIAQCGGGNFCVTLKTGTYAGAAIGKLAPNGERYKGKITDPATDKTYSGKASVAGAKLKMSGCVLGGLICQTQTWSRM